MLFYKYRRTADHDAEDRYAPFDGFTLHVLLGRPDADQDAERVINMNARKHVGRCVPFVHRLRKADRDVVSREFGRTYIKPVRIYHVDNQKDRHAEIQEENLKDYILLYY